MRVKPQTLRESRGAARREAEGHPTYMTLGVILGLVLAVSIFYCLRPGGAFWARCLAVTFTIIAAWLIGLISRAEQSKLDELYGRLDDGA